MRVFLKTADADLFVSCFGEGGPPLVAHGGWVGSGELWLQPFEILSRRRRCITYDHRGTGATIHRGGPITSDLLLDDLFRVLDHLRVERCVLAGESAGAMTVLQAALRAPERFSGLVLLDPRYQGGRSEGAARLLAGCRQDFAATMSWFVQACTPEPDCAAERAWGQRIVMRSNAEHAVQLMECVEHLHFEPQLPDIRIPTLLIHGTLDVITPLANAEKLAATLPAASLVKIEGAGHVPTLTRPAVVAEAIERFFPSTR
jgi:pimeloyl-ACP methyl ester carboxylesterase